MGSDALVRRLDELVGQALVLVTKEDDGPLPGSLA